MRVPQYPLKRRPGGLQNRSGCLEKSKIYYTNWESKARFLNLVNMLTTLFRLSFPTMRICKQNGGLWSGEDKSVGSVDAVDDSVPVTALG